MPVARIACDDHGNPIIIFTSETQSLLDEMPHCVATCDFVMLSQLILNILNCVSVLALKLHLTSTSIQYFEPCRSCRLTLRLPRVCMEYCKTHSSPVHSCPLLEVHPTFGVSTLVSVQTLGRCSSVGSSVSRLRAEETGWHSRG